MKFDKEIFEAHYGNKLILSMYIEICLVALCFVTQMMGITALGLIKFLIAMIVPFFVLPITFSQYIRRKKQSERQKQWFENEILYIEQVPDNGLTAGGFVKHKILVKIERIDSAYAEKRFIIVNGNIHVEEVFNGVRKEYSVMQYKIPRCFTGEEQIISLKCTTRAS